jgi:endogenous inhibitor of DNA gyrase (YacG/DUF329 family)
MGELIGYCEICGKQFKKYRDFHACCSNLCRRIKTEKDNYGYTKKEEETKKCLHCGTEFKTNNKNKVYCSKKCYIDHQENYHIKKEIQTRVCEACGKEFETTHHAKKYCSEECYKDTKKIREHKNV